VDRTVIGANVYVGAGAKIERSVIFDNVTIGRGAIVRNAILDKNVIVPDGYTIGVDEAEDRRRGFTVSESGVVALAKNHLVIP
jgi:glucose-1-phosphate adenylyltransferase